MRIYREQKAASKKCCLLLFQIRKRLVTHSQVFFIFGTARSENFVKHFFISCLFFFRKWAVGSLNVLHPHSTGEYKNLIRLRPFQKPPHTFSALPKNQSGQPHFKVIFSLWRFCKLLYLSSMGQKNIYILQTNMPHIKTMFSMRHICLWRDHISSAFKQLT